MSAGRSAGWRVVDWLLLSALCATAGCGACEPESQPLSEAAGPVAPGQVGSSLPARSTIRDRGGARFRGACRAIAVDGEVAASGPEGDPSPPAEAAPPALSVNAEIPNDGWLALAKGARLVVRDPRSGREVSFKGPARARACVAAQEESWVSRGRLESTAGSGEAPGAEEWIVMPLGVLRFGAARLTVEVSATEARAEIASGAGFVWLPQDGTASAVEGHGALKPDAEGWVRVGLEGAALRPKSERTPLQAARAAVAWCAGLAKSTRTLATAVLARERGDDSDAEGGQGARSARQVATRRLARAACAVAALRVAELPAAVGPAPEAMREALSASLRDADRTWRELPGEPSEETPEETR